MTLVSLPNTLVAGTPEDIVDVDQNIKAIRDVVNGLLGTDNFAAGSLNGDRLVAASIAAAKLASNSVETAKIVDKAVTPAKVGIVDFVEAYSTAADPVVSGAGDPINFTATRVETVAGMWDIAQPTRLVAKRPGLFLAGGCASFSPSAGDAWRAQVVLVRSTSAGAVVGTYGYNGANLFDATLRAAGGVQAAVCRPIPMDLDDYIEIIGYAEHVGTVTMLPSNAGTTRYGEEGFLCYMGPLA
jgi:hypothetical protein